MVINNPAKVQPALPPTSLIICTRNRHRLIIETVQSVLAGDELPDEIVVVDQSQQPNTVLAGMGNQRGCEIRYIHSNTTGLSKSKNLAVAAASHELLVVIDDDMYVDADWFGIIVRAQIAAGPLATVTGRVLSAEEREGYFVPSITDNEKPMVYQGRIESSVLSAGHMAAYRSLMQSVGPFDERMGAGSHFPSAEDNDFCFRLLEAGFSIVHAPEAVVYHRAWRSMKEFNNLYWSYGRGEGAFLAKHMYWNDLFTLRRLLKDTLPRLIRFPWRYLHRPDLAMCDMAFSLGAYSGFLEWILTGQNNGRQGPAAVQPRPPVSPSIQKG
jgi:GT2 family glycosyltransferase